MMARRPADFLACALVCVMARALDGILGCVVGGHEDVYKRQALQSALPTYTR